MTQPLAIRVTYDLAMRLWLGRDLQAGRLEQACPDCGTWEAAGSHCSKCRRPMGPADWYRNGDKAGRAVAHERAAVIRQTHLKRGRGRPSASSATPRSDAALGGPLDPAVSRPWGVPSGPPNGAPDPGRPTVFRAGPPARPRQSVPPAAGDPR